MKPFIYILGDFFLGRVWVNSEDNGVFEMRGWVQGGSERIHPFGPPLNLN